MQNLASASAYRSEPRASRSYGIPQGPDHSMLHASTYAMVSLVEHLAPSSSAWPSGLHTAGTCLRCSSSWVAAVVIATVCTGPAHTGAFSHALPWGHLRVPPVLFLVEEAGSTITPFRRCIPCSRSRAVLTLLGSDPVHQEAPEPAKDDLTRHRFGSMPAN